MPAPIVNGGGKIENCWISNFEGFVTLILNLDRVILHTVMHHSSTSTHMPNLIEIDETFCGWTNVRTYVQADRHFRLALLGRLCRRVDLINDISTPFLCACVVRACSRWREMPHHFDVDEVVIGRQKSYRFFHVPATQRHSVDRQNTVSQTQCTGPAINSRSIGQATFKADGQQTRSTIDT